MVFTFPGPPMSATYELANTRSDICLLSVFAGAFPMILAVLLLHVENMSGGQRKDWREYETMEDAARRLIGVMDERAKRKAAGSLGVEPAEILNRPLSPDENGPSESDRGSGSLDRSGQLTPVREDTGDHAAARGGNGSGLEWGG